MAFNAAKKGVNYVRSRSRRNGRQKNGNGNGVVVAPMAQSRRTKTLFADGYRVSHREFFSSVVSSTGYVKIGITIQPGWATIFPWLARIALNYETYKFENVSIHYIPRCATTTVGTVGLAPEYDVMDRAPTSMSEALNSKGAVSGAAWTELVCNLDVNSMYRLVPRKKIRTDTAIAADDELYDSAVVWLCTDGMAAGGTNLGQLWIEYTVQLFTPQMSGETAKIPKKTSVLGTAGAGYADTDPVIFEVDVLDRMELPEWTDHGGLILPNGNFHVALDMDLSLSAAGIGGLEFRFGTVPISVFNIEATATSVGQPFHVHVDKVVTGDGVSALECFAVCGVLTLTVAATSTACITVC